MSKEMGNHLRFIRKSRTDYTQTDVAKLLFLNRVTYTKYELGDSEPSIETIKRLCEIFDVDVAELLYYERNEYIKTNQ